VWRSFSKRGSLVAALAMTTVLAVSADAAIAAEHDLDFPAGTACDFELAADVAGGHQVEHTFVDATGNTVRTLSTGVGSQLTFTNLSTGATIAFRSNGSVTNTVSNTDGSQTVTLIGHNVLILFPTDVPAGPSTTLYVGRVVFTIGPPPDEVFTLVSTSGTATDICAALS
jgi:hypothetical protein